MEPTLRQGLRLAPDNPELIADLGQHLLQAGKVDDAEAAAREALSIDAACADAMLLMGHVLLRRGDIQGAQEQALLCLAADANSRPALHLLCAVKMRTNPFLGLWWRFAVWMGRFGNTNTLVIIIGSYVAYRLAAQLLDDHGHGDVAMLLSIPVAGPVRLQLGRRGPVPQDAEEGAGGGACCGTSESAGQRASSNRAARRRSG